MSTRVIEAIRHRIRTDGPIDIATYMRLALYGPGGFYEEPPIGAEGDFVTSPHVHPAFGAFVARALGQLAASLPAARRVRILEVGAGDGTLAGQILTAGIGRPIRYAAVEISPGARRALGEVTGVTVLEREEPTDLVLAHELLDNLPFRVVRDEREIRVALDGDDLVEQPTAIDDELTALIGDADTAKELVVPVGALAFVDRVAQILQEGYALLVDYGGRTTGGPMHGYRTHVPLEDILAAPGETDITAGVDFGWIERRAGDRGMHALGSVTQHRALLALGFEEWLRDELGAQHDHLEAGRGLDAVRTWSGRSRATLLADPAALGRLRWCLLATPGLPAPQWFTDAADG